MVKAFNDKTDIHARTAAIVHGIMPAMVTPELRSQAKVVNYGLMYGMGASRLANETGMTPPEAKRFIEAYFRALPKVKEYLDGSLQAARSQHYVRTLFGRIRPLLEIDSGGPSLVCLQSQGLRTMANLRTIHWIRSVSSLSTTLVAAKPHQTFRFLTCPMGRSRFAREAAGKQQVVRGGLLEGRPSFF